MPVKSLNSESIPSIKGRAWCFGDNVSTDDIIAGEHLTTLNLEDIAQQAFKTIRPEFAKQVQPNDIIVGGHAFGIGSSRESAPGILHVLGVGAVIAASFARLFFRNAFNLGLPAVEIPAFANTLDLVQEGDQLTLHLARGKLYNHRSRKTIETTRIPSFLLSYLKAGGAIPLLKEKLVQ